MKKQNETSNKSKNKQNSSGSRNCGEKNCK